MVKSPADMASVNPYTLHNHSSRLVPYGSITGTSYWTYDVQHSNWWWLQGGQEGRGQAAAWRAA